jgi:hypothetical protein
MPLYEAIQHLETMYSDVDDEAEKLLSEDVDLYQAAKTDRRALAVALENLYQLIQDAQ